MSVRNKIKILSILIVCSASSLLHAGVPGFEPIKWSELKARVAAAYPGTMAGYKEIADTINGFPETFTADVIESNKFCDRFIAMHRNNLQAILHDIRVNNPIETAGDKFNRIFASISEEVSLLHSPVILTHLDSVYLRALLLFGNGHVSEEFKSLIHNTPGSKNLLAALQPTPKKLPGCEVGQLAWEHSSLACGQNAELLPDYVSKNTLYTGEEGKHLHYAVNSKIKEYLVRAMPGEVEVVVRESGVLGVTTLVEAYLHFLKPIGIAGDGYQAHGVKFNKVEASVHDLIHGELTDHDDSLLIFTQAILQNWIFKKGKIISDSLIESAADEAVKRYNAFKGLLKQYVEKKQEELVGDINLASGDKVAISAAKQKYNRWLVPLFQILHERYTLDEDVLMKNDAISALMVLCGVSKNPEAKGKEATLADPLLTLVGKSPLNDDEIIAKLLEGKQKSEYGILEGGDAVKTLADCNAEGLIHSLQLNNNNSVIEVEFTTQLGEVHRVSQSTIAYALGTTKDEAKLLKLMGVTIAEPVLDLVALGVLSAEHEDRANALASIKEYVKSVSEAMDNAVKALADDILRVLPVDAIAGYDALLASQDVTFVRAAVAGSVLPAAAPVS